MLQIKQICVPGENISWSGEWSNNLLNKSLCYSISINSLPGNKFKINDNTIIINNTGTFNMDFNIYPVESLRLYRYNNYETYQTVIDLVYQTTGGIN